MTPVTMLTLTNGKQVAVAELHSACLFFWGLIGDVFVRVAVLEALKAHFPQLRITVVVDPAGKAVVEHHPAVAEVVVFSRRKQPVWAYLRNTLRCVWQLRQRRFDLSINLYSGGSSPRIVRWVNARVRLGFDHSAALRRSNNLLVNHPSFCTHWTKSFGKVLAPLGITAAQIRQGTSFHTGDEAKRLAAEFFAQDSNRYVVYNLGAGVPTKRWPVRNFVALAQAIQQQYGLSPLVLTNPGMETLAEEFVVLYQKIGYCRKVPVLPLDQLGAIIEQYGLIVTGDTSIMHMAFGLKVPTVVLFTYTRPEIVEPADCLHVDCFIEDPQHINECGKPSGTVEIPVDYALEQFRRLMAMNAASLPG